MKLTHLTALFLGAFVCANAHAALKPNIIFILADDMGPGILSCEGQQIIKTPNIDGLAKQGMTFTRVYSSKYCCPARATLITGCHNKHKDSYTQTGGGMCVQRDEKGDMTAEELNQKAWENIKIKPTEKEVFLPQLLKQAGYRTGQFGKLDWGFMTCHQELTRHGWDEYVGYYDHVRAHGFYPKYLWKNGKELPLPGNTFNNAGKTPESYGPGSTEKRRNREGCQTYAPDVMIAEALKFMQEDPQKPFFLFLSTNLPHGPVDIPTKDITYKDNPEIKKAYADAKGGNVECYSAAEEYASMVDKLDKQVGMLKAAAIALYKKTKRPTIIFFSSDNGHEIYYRADKGRGHVAEYHGGVIDGSGELLDVFKGNRAFTPDGKHISDLSNLKWSTNEGGIRTPLIVWYPFPGGPKIKPGSINTRLTAIYDHMATFAQIAGTKMPEGKDGKSYADTLFGGKGTPAATHPYIIADESVITADNWKYMPGGKNGPQLYNLTTDPGEKTNLATSNKAKLDELKAIFQKENNSPRLDK